jgi:hypothetical protein
MKSAESFMQQSTPRFKIRFREATEQLRAHEPFRQRTAAHRMQVI